MRGVLSSLICGDRVGLASKRLTFALAHPDASFAGRIWLPFQHLFAAMGFGLLVSLALPENGQNLSWIL